MNGRQPNAGISALVARAQELMPGGVSHDGRQLDPFGLFIRSARGARKLGEDGRSYIDFACGNGSLLLGHGDKRVVEAATRAAADGFHFSAGSEVELRWAEAVQTLMPAAEQIRFTSSGNEACLLALAIARAVTRRPAVLTLAGHYHGWAAPAVLSRMPLGEFLAAPPSGDGIMLVEAPDVAQAADALESGRFGSLVLEPTGASFGRIPLSADEARALAAAAARAGTVCVFDETITGFRVAPGGAHSLFGIKPDLIVLGKILGGGLPCGALAGRRDLLGVLDNRSGRGAYISHMGTGNGNPLVAAVGTQMLIAIADGTAIAHADAMAKRLRDSLNRLFAEKRIPWAAYGESSGFHIFTNPRRRTLDQRRFDPARIPLAELGARDGQLVNALRFALLLEGVDINPWPGGLLSAAHDEAIIDEAMMHFARALSDRFASQPESAP